MFRGGYDKQLGRANVERRITRQLTAGQSLLRVPKKAKEKTTRTVRAKEKVLPKPRHNLLNPVIYLPSRSISKTDVLLMQARNTEERDVK